MKVQLKVIPAPLEGTRTVFQIQGLFPAFKGKGETDLVCGHCGQCFQKFDEVNGIHVYRRPKKYNS
jgi:hypothetical protein